MSLGAASKSILPFLQGQCGTMGLQSPSDIATPEGGWDRHLQAHVVVAEGGGAGRGVDAREDGHPVLGLPGQPQLLVHPLPGGVVLCTS